MRLFIAAPLEENMKESLYRDMADFRSRYPGITWVRPGAMHITLVFLGEIPDENPGDVTQALEGIGATVKPFTLVFKGFGAFPPKGKPRVIFCRVEEGAAELQYIYRACSSGLKGFIPANSKPSFKPHLTIGRVKRKGNAGGLMSELTDLRYTSLVDRFVLYRSVLKSTGPEYHEEWVGRL